MSTQTFVLDESDKSYSAEDWRREGLKTGQIYRWRITKLEAGNSKSGKPMVTGTVTPVTESGAALKQFSQKFFLLIPRKSDGEKAYRMSLKRYFNIVQSFCAPAFNAFSRIEKDGETSRYFNKDGVELDRNGREQAINKAKGDMLDARETILDYLSTGQEAYALLKAPNEGSNWPELGNFSQDVDPNSEIPFADSAKEMIG